MLPGVRGEVTMGEPNGADPLARRVHELELRATRRDVADRDLGEEVGGLRGDVIRLGGELAGARADVSAIKATQLYQGTELGTLRRIATATARRVGVPEPELADASLDWSDHEDSVVRRIAKIDSELRKTKALARRRSKGDWAKLAAAGIAAITMLGAAVRGLVDILERGLDPTTHTEGKP